MGKLVHKRELCEIVGVTNNTMTKWQKEGMPIKLDGTRGTANQYDTEDVIKWMINRKIGKFARGSSDEILNKEQEEARLKKHQADKAEIEAKKARGDVLLLEDVKDILNEVAVVYGTQLDSLGGRIANDIAAISNPAEIRQLIFAEARRIRGTTADRLEAFVIDAGERFSENS